MNTIVGKQSICFQRPPQIVSAASVAGQKEGEGPLGALFDEIEKDPMAGQATWEEAESALQKRAAHTAVLFLLLMPPVKLRAALRGGFFAVPRPPFSLALRLLIKRAFRLLDSMLQAAKHAQILLRFSRRKNVYGLQRPIQQLGIHTFKHVCLHNAAPSRIG